MEQKNVGVGIKLLDGTRRMGPQMKRVIFLYKMTDF